jgi:TonB-dependent SusC/RagA subfamily outer membrane receptor
MLRARAIGHTPQSRQITLRPGEIVENFALKQDVNRLSEVVITGVTGETEKRKLAFDIARVDQQDLAAVPAANPLSQIQGKIPGAHIVQSTGRPGQAPSTLIRGPKSINAENRSQGPLIVVDGVILEGGTQDLNPQDVESVEVVKGAAAASIYGSRAEAGVIQITTKSGKNAAQGTRFNFRTEYGLQNVQNEYPYARGHFVMMDENNERFCIAVTGQPACSRTVDFEEEAFRVNDQGGDFALQPYNFIRDYGIGLAPPIRDA